MPRENKAIAKGFLSQLNSKTSSVLNLLGGFSSVIALLVYSPAAKAQFNSQFLNYSDVGRSVSLNMDFDAGSNGVNSALVNKLIWGGYIDNDLKKQSATHLKGKNNFGVNLNYGFSAFIKGTKDVDFLVAVKDQELINAGFTSDLYNLVFYGNESFKGKTADLSGTNINALRFQELKFGAITRNDSTFKFGASVSFLKGEQLFYVKANDGSGLYTAENGSELILNSKFNMSLSDPNNQKFASLNGVGASADIFLEKQYNSRIGKKSVFIVTANNLGFIHWLDNSMRYSSDSSLHFSGYHTNNILGLKDSTLNKISGDSMLRSVANARRGAFNTNLPANLLLMNKIYFGQQLFCLTIGYRQIFNANFTPYVFLEPEYRIKNVRIALHAGYGGYVRLNIGPSVTWNSKGWYLKVGSNGLQGFLLPKTSTGQSLFFSLAKKIG